MQDGTINYLNLPAITDGLRFLSAYLPFLPLRLSSLTRHLITSLSELRHDSTDTPVVQILSRRPTKDVRTIGEQSDTGSTVSLLFLSVSPFFPPSTSSPQPQHAITIFRGAEPGDGAHSKSHISTLKFPIPTFILPCSTLTSPLFFPLLAPQPSGQMLPNSFVEYAASTHNISLRTGCMCNPGGAAALLGLRAAMAQLPTDATLRAFEQCMGRELGVVRLSLGLASDFRDVWRVVEFARLLSTERARGALWDKWLEDRTGVAL